MSEIAKVAVIEFDERPALDHATASEQLEHLYIHVGLTQEKLNAVVERYSVERRELLDRIEHLERRLNGEWPYERAVGDSAASTETTT
jgi:hypothetical protein